MKRPARTSFRYFPVSARDRRWGLWLTTTGESSIPAGSVYPPAVHPGGYQFDWRKGRTLPEYQIVYISSGEGLLEMRRRKSFRIQAGTAFILFPGVWHRYRPDPRTGWTEHWIGGDGPILRGLVKHAFFSNKSPLQRVKYEDLLLGAFSSITEASHAHQPALQQVMAGMTLYILSLLYSSQLSAENSQTRVTSAVHTAISRMSAARDRETVDLKQIAKDIGVSYTWLRRSFTLHTGLSPHQYQLSLKLGRARTLLLDTSLSVKEIAHQTGFASEYYFCRLFRRKTGIPPGRWRRESRW
jgi:AraC-like DNA-binding protein